MKRFLQDRRGASEYIEAIITFPMVLLLTIAIINGGMVVYGQSAVQDAARQGARMGSVAQMGAAAFAASNARQAMSKVTFVQNVKVRILAPGGVAGSILKIEVSGDVPNLFRGLLPGLADKGYFHVSADSTFRQEGW